MANRTRRTAERDLKFLESLSQGASVAAAAKDAGYGRQHLYEWREADPELAAAWDNALEAGTDLLEDEALRRAKDGVDEPRFYEGEVCGHVRKYSDTLLIFLLKARRPWKYADKAQAEHSGILEISWMEPGEQAPLPPHGYRPPMPDRYRR
jgi:Bacteriophage Sf6, terminase small subunit-like